MSVRQTKKFNMPEGHRYCIKCHGRKIMYKSGHDYSIKCTGGKKVDCPVCKGKGIVLTLEAKAKELKNNERRQSKPISAGKAKGKNKGAEK